MSIYIPKTQSFLAVHVGNAIANVWRGSLAQRWWRRFDSMMVNSRPDRVIRRYLKARFAERDSWPNKRPGL